MIKNFFARLLQFYLNLKIIWKMIIGFGLTLILVFLMAVLGQVSINSINLMMDDLITNQLEPLVYLNDIRSYISEVEVMTRDAVLQNDLLAINYIKNVHLSNTVLPTVEYSFENLVKIEGQPNGSVFQHWIPERFSNSDRRMAEDTIAVIKELEVHWQNYYLLYEKGLKNVGLFKDQEFIKEANQLRYFLIGGIDRLVETHYRQQAMIAKNEAEKTFTQQQILSWILLTVIVLLAGGISYLTAWSIITPLKQMANSSKRIAEGNLQVRLPQQRKDEFGEVAACFNTMADELNLLVHEIKNAVEKVNEHSQKLVTGSQEANLVTKQLVGTLSQVSDGAEIQREKVTSIHELVQAVSWFSQAVNQITYRVEELSKGTVAKALEGGVVVDEVCGKFDRIKRFMTESDQTMKNLQVLSREIGGIVSTVKEVAEQTNLLSLNATIESARAGEYGRGFSVVAESIGELADRTKIATTQVQSLVKRIQANFMDLSKMIATEKGEIIAGENSVTGLGTVFASIIAAAQEVNQELSAVTQSTTKMVEENKNVLAAVEQITEIALQHRHGTLLASDSAEEHFCYTQEIIGISQILAHWGQNLEASVGKFN